MARVTLSELHLRYDGPVPRQHMDAIDDSPLTTAERIESFKSQARILRALADDCRGVIIDLMARRDSAEGRVQDNLTRAISGRQRELESRLRTAQWFEAKAAELEALPVRAAE